MFKLIAIDLDGTLLNDKKLITRENLQTLNELILMGYEIVIATGRRYFSAKELTRGIDSHMTIIANNGNIVRRSEDDRVLFSKYMNELDYKYIIKEGRRRGLSPMVHVDYFNEGFDIILEDNEGLIDKPHSFLINERRIKLINKDSIFDVDRVLTIVYAGDKPPLDDFYNHINLQHPEKYSSHVMENVDIAEAMLEVMNPLANKWISILGYAKSLGIKPNEIIAIGDNNNDLPMILNAGLGIAMNNGTSLLKEAANITTEYDNNNSGVAFELRKVLNIK